MRGNSSETTERQNDAGVLWRCAKCFKMFKPELSQHELGDIRDDKGVVKYFVACPHCQTEYVTHHMSNHVRDLQTKFQKTRSPRDQIPFNQALTALQVRMKSRGHPVNPEFS